jgi:predicted nucleic acid-binding protein
VIVVDASTLVSATFRRGSVPGQAVRHALQTGRVAVSEPVMAEFLDVLHRPGLSRYIDPGLRAHLAEVAGGTQIGARAISPPPVPAPGEPPTPPKPD